MEENTTIHVAYAEDHTLIRKGVIALLKSNKEISVDIEVENGRELLDQIEEAEIKPAICIIDINMPVLDGFLALREIRRRWPDMKTLILSTFSGEEYVIRMMYSGANGYLLKKCTEDEITDAIFSIYNYGYYYSECANSTLFHLIRTNSIKPQPLTKLEVDFLKYCCTELTYTQIAAKMNTTLSSVNGCRDRLFTKLNFTSRVELALFAVQFGLTPIEINTSGKTVIQLKN